MAKTKLPPLPAGPKGPGRFGAYYTHLKWDKEWDSRWRVADHPDVVVRFDDGGHRFVFWRGTSYIPCWVTDNGRWYTNEFVERRGHHSPNTDGCCEPMSDKQCRFSHVRIIESTPARVVIHWRYAPVDVSYQQPFINPETNWGDWVDEYYTIYPDSTCVRVVNVHTDRPDLWLEFHEAIVVNQPGSMPEESIELDALTVSNMAGDTKTYSWANKGGPPLQDFWERWDANIIKINLKAKRVPWAMVPPHQEYGLLITPYSGHAPTSHFNFWNHWPVAQVASDGRLAKTPDRPSHSSLCHFDLQELGSAKWPKYDEVPGRVTKIMLNGMTELDAGELIHQGNSWLNPPAVKVAPASGANAADTARKQGGERGGTGSSKRGQRGEANFMGFDATQYAYVFAAGGNSVIFAIDAGGERPAIRPGIVISGWEEREIKVSLNGKQLSGGRDYRTGWNHHLEGDELIVWLDTEITKPSTISIS